MPQPKDRQQTLKHLQQQLRRREQPAAPQAASAGVVSTGIAALDRRLPEGGWRPGSLVEWLAEPASGADSLLFQLAAAFQQTGRGLLVVDPAGEFYPPAVELEPGDWQRTVVVRPRSEAEGLWAWEQALRCPGVAAVVGRWGSLSRRAFRRWQLAAEAGGTLGLLLRPVCYRRQPSWARLRLGVEPLVSRPESDLAAERGRRLRVRVLAGAGSWSEDVWELELGDATGIVSVAAGLAPAELAEPAAGA